MLNLIKRYMPPVKSYRVDLYEHETPLFRLKIILTFTDDSRLHVKEYRFTDSSRKYSFHWESNDGKLKIRWDNAEHWRDISTFPHHKHIGTSSNVQPSTETSLEAILHKIASLITQNDEAKAK